MNSLYKCRSFDDLSTKLFVLNETKNVNAKVFNIITKINEVKVLVKHISFDFK